MKTKHRRAARAKEALRHTQEHDDTRLDSFGLMFDPRTGRMRNWYQDEGDVKRWAETGLPVEHLQGMRE